MLLLAAIAIAANATVALQVDRSTTVPLAGLNGPATLTTDAQGITHVRANNEPDLWFLQGYVHASDRLFQLDYNRRLAEGTLAELVGEAAVPTDVQLRTLGLDRAAARSLMALSSPTRHALERYAAGVNAWIAANPLPMEYGLLELTQFKPWEAQDCAAVASLLLFGLTFDTSDVDRTILLLTYVQTGLASGFDGQALFFEDVHRTAPMESTTTLPPLPDGDAPRADLDLGHLQLGLLRDWREAVARAPWLDRLARERRDRGSNSWVIAGEHSMDGQPMLAADPHLGLTAPSTWYPLGLKAGAFEVAGHSFPGVPFVINGHNAHIAWSTTTLAVDGLDFYQEQLVPDAASPSGLSTLHEGMLEPILPLPESYLANQLGNGVLDDLATVPPGPTVPPFTLIVPRRLDGPIVQLDAASGVALSVQYVLSAPARVLDAFRGFDRAKSLAEFRAALKYFDVGAQNLFYADVTGRIAYFTSGEVPVREDLQAGFVAGLPPSFVRNGTGGNEWLAVQHPVPGQALPYEILPFDEMPHAIDPAVGWLANANNDPDGGTLDNDVLNRARPGGGIHYIAAGHDIGLRATTIDARLSGLIASGAKLDRAEMARLQADTEIAEARLFLPHLLTAYDRAQSPAADPQLAALGADAGVVEAVARLRAWDRSAPTGIVEGYDAADRNGKLSPPSALEVEASVATTIFYVWIGTAIEEVTERTLTQAGLPTTYSLQPLHHMLDTFDVQQGVGASGLDFFAVPGVTAAEDRRDVVLLRSLAIALSRLSGPEFESAFARSPNQDEYRWGRLHRLVLEHPLGGALSIPPAAGAFPAPLASLPGIPVDGGINSVDVGPNSGRLSSPEGFVFTAGPSHRTVYTVAGGRMRAWTSLPGGTSGSVASSSYLDLLPAWLTNDAFLLRFGVADIFQNAVSITKLQPAP